MIVFPALDLRHGRVVRLVQGDPGRQTVFSDDPFATAIRWQAGGASWIHLVDLDGALSGEGQDFVTLIKRISQQQLLVQFGGGLRSFDAITQALEAGATRVVIGTLAVGQPSVLREALAHFGPEKIVAALDSRGGTAMSHGWQLDSGQAVVDIGRKWAATGLRHALYTDIRRDGLMGGVNVVETASFAQATGLSVIASGGVSSLADIEALRATGVIEGVVIGRALYTGEIGLKEALEIAGAAAGKEKGC